MAEGPSPRKAVTDVLELCASQLEFAFAQGDIGWVFRPAPAEFWTMYAMAQDSPLAEEPPKPIATAEARN